MRYLVEFFVQVVVAFVVLYSGAWFYFSGKIEDQAREVLNQIGAQVTENNPHGRLFHGEVRVSGYPLYMRVEIDQLRVKTNLSSKPTQQSNLNADIYLDNTLFIESEIFGNKTYIHLPQSIGFILANNNENNFDNLNNIVLKNGIIEVELSKSPIGYFFNSGNILPFAYRRLENDLVSLKYSDDGLEIFTPKGDISYFNSEGHRFFSSNSERDGKFIRKMKMSSLGTNIKENFTDEFLKAVVGLYPEDKEKLKNAAAKLSQHGNISYSLDGELNSKELFPISLYEVNIIMSDFALNINKISLKNDLYSFDIDGSIKKSADDNSLEGAIKIDFNNYKKGLAEWSKTISFLLNLYNVNDDEIVKALEKAAEISEGDKNMSLKLERIGRNELNIGKVTLSEFMELLPASELRNN